MATAKNTKSKPGTDVLALLTAQHEEVDTLFEKLEKMTGDKKSTIIELADKLGAHATIEEKVFYPGVMSKETNEMLQESVEEHLEIKRLLADLLSDKLSAEQVDAKLSVLEENVSHHAHEEEEGKLFPLLRESMSDDELGALGSECLAMFEALMPQHPSQNIPNETDRAAPLPSVA